jgi:uncharacterized protein (TIGR02246 family)
MQEDKNKQVIREFKRIFKNEHNVDGVEHLFDTRNFVHHFRAPLPTGFEGFRQVGIMMNGAFPDVVVKEEDLVAAGDGDRVVERSSASATHKGSMMGEKPTGKRIAWSEIHIYRLKDGKICEPWAEIAMMELLQQVGVLPQAAPANTQEDEKAIRALNDVFIKGFLSRDPKLRASIWSEDGTLVPPQGGFCQGRVAVEKHFHSEGGSITPASKASFSNERIRFISPTAAFVDADLTVKNIQTPDGKILDPLPVGATIP